MLKAAMFVEVAVPVGHDATDEKFVQHLQKGADVMGCIFIVKDEANTVLGYHWPKDMPHDFAMQAIKASESGMGRFYIGADLDPRDPATVMKLAEAAKRTESFNALGGINPLAEQECHCPRCTAKAAGARANKYVN